MAHLKIERVSKTFGEKRLFIDASLTIKTGEILGVFGRNGSGKSSLLKILFGTLQADRIVGTIDDKVFEPKKVIARQQIGYLPQFSFLPRYKKVRQVIPLFLEAGELQDKVFYAPRIAKIENQGVGQLSIGERRYLELLLLAHAPHPFLLLDEPFSMIEPLYKDIIKALLTDIKSRKGIILTDHYFLDVLPITNRNILLKNESFLPVFGEKDLEDLGYLPEKRFR